MEGASSSVGASHRVVAVHLWMKEWPATSMNAENARASEALAIWGMSTVASEVSRPMTPARKGLFRSFSGKEPRVARNDREVYYRRHRASCEWRPNAPCSVERHLFKASHPKCPRCSSRQINTTSLYEGTAVVNPDSYASSALLGCNCNMGAEGLRAMSGSHCSRNHPLAGCGSTAAIAIMRGNACLGKYGGRRKGKS